MTHVAVRAATITPLLQPLFRHFLSPQTPTTFLSVCRHARLPARALRLPREPHLDKATRSSSNNNGDSDSEDEGNEENEKKKKKSRNEMKREARLAVRWGMDLASFSTPLIQRILKAASLEREVFDALLLVKRLGPDVREGKRRQFNYIGKLLRDADAQPHLLGALIQAAKDGDESRFQALAGSTKRFDEGPEEEFHESEFEQEHEDTGDHLILASKWFDGLIEKNIQISNEVYSIDSVEFDRQELRRLVRKVHNAQGRQNSIEDDPENNAELTTAKKSLNHFLCSLAKRQSRVQDVLV